jgi:dTDP-4-dehydrorhamnose 3,5-epimerase
VEIRELDIPDAFEITPLQHPDGRGLFLEAYRADVLGEAVGHALSLRQANMSISARGALRGIHFALVRPGQAKYVTVTSGRALDFVIDLRVGSPKFGRWTSVVLDDESFRAVYLAEGLGHAVLALSERVVVSYLVSEMYSPEREFGINPLDPDIALEFPEGAGPLVISPKDQSALSLHDAQGAGLLATWDDCKSFYAELNGQG